MQSLWFKLGFYNKIYDSYQESDIYVALYKISLGLSQCTKTVDKINSLEHKLLKLSGEHIRIYEEWNTTYKIVFVRKSNKLIYTKYFCLKLNT